ncbi:MAG: hypothetical protein US57_C0018G0022 [Candidatus Moranbacteria bacterium GW2011_GWC2_37_73]|nr:MAG: hypothetical protein UR95_C0004G0022 [Parcubacteria group bacterium GW2011_GWC1_36_108]KKQ39177.1 MAG: hypothetical protein US57_C0018G0022 [Candidatus Moranbacteria bacterium GW2011_GWC2_37_73]
MQQKIKRQQKFLDITPNKTQQNVVNFRSGIKNSKSTLFSRGKRTQDFFTEDSRLYITPKQQALLRKGVKINQNLHRWDSLSSRVVTEFVRYQPSETSLLLKYLEKRYEMFNDATGDAARSFVGQFSTVRLWNASIVGAILFGMVTMTFVYKYLGQGAAAADDVLMQQAIESQATTVYSANTEGDAASFAEQVAQIQQTQSKQALEDEITQMVKGYPIEKMVPRIAEQDRTVAAFIVAIAKKESNWGLRVPVLDGQDCYNYWGYRGIRERMGTGGHTCFDDTTDAVDTVAKRITALVEEYDRNTPEEMVVWKCGSNCAVTGGQASANKWISDVTMYFDELNTDRS